MKLRGNIQKNAISVMATETGLRMLTSFIFLLHLLHQCSIAASAGVCESSEQLNSDSRSWLEKDRVLNTNGIVTAIIAQFCTTDVATVQLWEPEAVSNQYRLVWSRDVAPSIAAGEVRIPLDPDDHMLLTVNHRIGLAASSGREISIKQVFDTSSPQLLYSEDRGQFLPGNSYLFTDVGRPTKFLVDFCTNSGCPDVGVASVEPQPPPPPPPQPPSDTGACSKTQNPEGAVLLEKNHVMESGWIRALQAPFCNTGPIIAQVYEPVEEQGVTYRLIWQKTINPAYGDGEKNKILLSAAEVFYSRPSYRVGFQSADQGPGDFPLAIPSYFSDVYQGNLVKSTDIVFIDTCATRTFEDFGFPAQFNITFCTNTDCLPMDNPNSDDVPYTDICPEEDNGTKGDGDNSVVGESEAGQSGKGAGTLTSPDVLITLVLASLCLLLEVNSLSILLRS